MSSTVRAKFYVSSLTRNAYNPESTNVVLTAVTRGEENKEWAQYTPSGKVEMTVASATASAFFSDRLGKEFYLDFTEANPECPFCRTTIETQNDGAYVHLPEVSATSLYLHKTCYADYQAKGTPA